MIIRIYVVTMIESGVFEDQQVTLSKTQADMFVENWNNYAEGNDEIDVIFQHYDKDINCDNN